LGETVIAGNLPNRGPCNKVQESRPRRHGASFAEKQKLPHGRQLRKRWRPIRKCARGGGYYEHHRPAGEFNPHSPVEWRRFGAWGQGPRSVAYGFRAARTAP